MILELINLCIHAVEHNKMTHCYICAARPNLNWVTPITKKALQLKPTRHIMQIPYTLLQVFSSPPFVRSQQAMLHCVYTEMNDARNVTFYRCTHAFTGRKRTHNFNVLI